MTNAEARIANAYRDLVKDTFDGWVSLVNLRRSLADIDRATLDDTLHTMRRARTISFDLAVNQSRLTKEDRAAALKVGSDNMHFIIFN